MKTSLSALRLFIAAIFIVTGAYLLINTATSFAQNSVYLPVISGGASGTPTPTTSSTTYNDLWIPDVITGTTFNLTLSKTTKQLKTGAATTTYGYNGAHFWGPTLMLNKGDAVQMNVTNQLNEATTTHWHGLHIPAVMDGGPHQSIAAGSTWSPSFTLKNNAGTYWYHPHLHEKTQEQLAYGAGGLIIIKDTDEAKLALPRTYGVDDIPVVLTSRRFSADNQFDTTAVYGDEELTNGTLKAQVSLPAQYVRLRVLNAEIERAYNLGFSDNRTFYVIGNDGGLLDAPVPVQRVKMFVGERVELLVDLSGDIPGATLDLQAFNGNQAFGFPGGEDATSGEFGSLLNNKTFNVLHINVTAPTANAIKTLPTTLVHNTYWTDADVTNSRTIAITEHGPGTPFSFDNMSYDMMAINQTVSLNAVEKWTIVNSQVFGHSFHIHDVQFKIISRSSGPVAAYEQGWKDTVAVPLGESVSFIAKFADFADDTHPYMYHCHFSNHEDEGMMGQFLVK
ncbi:MAG: multicopper oxidase domain-containing protein [Caldilineaceae bacterium]